MKINVFLFVLIIITGCAPRISEGVYYQFSRGEYISPRIQFEKYNKFDWQTNGDLGIISVGSGTYKIKNNKLYLKFKKDSIAYESTVEVFDKEITDKDEVSLVIKVVDEQKQPMPRIKVSIGGNPEKKYYSDMDGKVTIHNFSKSEEVINIQTSAILGYENYNFNFTPNKNAKLLVTLYRAKPKLITEKTFVYKIINKNRAGLSLKNSEGQILEFKRVEE